MIEASILLYFIPWAYGIWTLLDLFLDRIFEPALRWIIYKIFLPKPQENTPMEKVYSRDAEEFKDYDCIMDELRDEFEKGTEVEIQEGLAQVASHSEFVTGFNWVEELQNRAYDEYGEYAESYLEELDPQAVKSLEALVAEWLEANAKPPTFYTVSDIKTLRVVVD